MCSIRGRMKTVLVLDVCHFRALSRELICSELAKIFNHGSIRLKLSLFQKIVTTHRVTSYRWLVAGTIVQPFAASIHPAKLCKTVHPEINIHASTLSSFHLIHRHFYTFHILIVNTSCTMKLCQYLKVIIGH
jgi:hypothetical protein